MFGLFKSKEQVEQVKELAPILPTATVIETTELQLSGVRIVYSVSAREPFQAWINYHERPTDWGNQGTTKEVNLKASSWPELIDKVTEHFNNQKAS